MTGGQASRKYTALSHSYCTYSPKHFMINRSSTYPVHTSAYLYVLNVKRNVATQYKASVISIAVHCDAGTSRCLKIAVICDTYSDMITNNVIVLHGFGI